MSGHRFLSSFARLVGVGAFAAMIACKPPPVKSIDPDQAWLDRLGSAETVEREKALDDLWAQKDAALLDRLLAKTPEATREGIRRCLGRLELGLSPVDPPGFVELADRLEVLTNDERHDLMRGFQDLPLARRLTFAVGALQRVSGHGEATVFWSRQTDGAIHGMENRITQRAGRMGQSPGGIGMGLVMEAQKELRSGLADAARRVTTPAAREALLKALRTDYAENKVYAITTLEFLWNRQPPSSSPVRVRAVEALLDLHAVAPAIEAAGAAPAAVDVLVSALAYDPASLELALREKPPRDTAVAILASLVRFPGWEREAGYSAAVRLDDAWQPWPASDAETTQADRDLAYYAAAAANARDPAKAMDFATRYRHPAAAEVVGRGVKSAAGMQFRSSDPINKIPRIVSSNASRDVKLEVLRQVSFSIGTLTDFELNSFLRLSRAWFPDPDAATLPSWHTITRGIAVLRFERDWAKTVQLLNRASSDPMAGRCLSIEIHNHWPDWREEAESLPNNSRLPVPDVGIMNPELFMAFLSEIEFQWENSPLNLKGYQLHLRGKDLRWKLQSTDTEHLDLIRMARDAELAGDKQSSWELLQIVSLGRLPLFHPWDPRNRFAARFPLAAYLSQARARGAMGEELQRLDAYDARRHPNPPVILSSALELAQGDDAAALARLEAEKKHPNVPLPTTAERLELLRGYLADADLHAADPAKWWDAWMRKGFPKD